MKQPHQTLQPALSVASQKADESHLEKKNTKLKKEDNKGNAEKQGPLSTRPTFSVDGGDSPRGKQEVPSPEGRGRVPSGLDGKEELPKEEAINQTPSHPHHTITKRDGDIEEFQKRRI